MSDDLPGVEDHEEAFAASLRVPDHPDTAVTELHCLLPIRRALLFYIKRVSLLRGRKPSEKQVRLGLYSTGGQGGVHGLVDSMVLVVGRHLLYHLRPVILKHNKIQNKVKQPLLLEYPFEQYLKLDGTWRGYVHTVNGSPRHEAVPS